MSSTTSQWDCPECKSTNGVNEDFRDDEIGHISECFACGFHDVYREDSETEKVIEDYQGYKYPTVTKEEVDHKPT